MTFSLASPMWFDKAQRTIYPANFESANQLQEEMMMMAGELLLLNLTDYRLNAGYKQIVSECLFRSLFTPLQLTN